MTPSINGISNKKIRKRSRRSFKTSSIAGTSVTTTAIGGKGEKSEWDDSSVDENSVIGFDDDGELFSYQLS